MTDFNAAMDKLIRDNTPDGEAVAHLVAAKVVATAPRKVLIGWLTANAEQLLAQHISDKWRSERPAARARASSRAFATASARGDRSPAFASAWTARYSVNDKDGQKPTYAWTRLECLYVADSLASSSKALALKAEFFKAVAKKMRDDQIISDLYSQKQFEALWNKKMRGIVKAKAASAA